MITGFPNNTTWIISKMMWVRKNEPEIWDKTYKVIQLQDFALKSLGSEGYFNDVSDSGFYGLWETDNFKWSKKLLDIFDINEEMLPSVVPSCTKVGVIGKAVSKVPVMLNKLYYAI